MFKCFLLQKTQSKSCKPHIMCKSQCAVSRGILQVSWSRRSGTTAVTFYNAVFNWLCINRENCKGFKASLKIIQHRQALTEQGLAFTDIYLLITKYECMHGLLYFMNWIKQTSFDRQEHCSGRYVEVFRLRALLDLNIGLYAELCVLFNCSVLKHVFLHGPETLVASFITITRIIWQGVSKIKESLSFYCYILQ